MFYGNDFKKHVYVAHRSYLKQNDIEMSEATVVITTYETILRYWKSRQSDSGIDVRSDKQKKRNKYNAPKKIDKIENRR